MSKVAIITGASSGIGAASALGLYARPDDVADTIAWLIEGARQVTGEAIFVDGGLHITPPR